MADPDPSRIDELRRLTAEGRIADAAALCRAALAQPDLTASDLIVVGQTLLLSGRAAQAASPLRLATERAPDSAEAHAAYGRALQRLGRLRAAADAYGRSVEIEPRNSEAQGRLGEVRFALGNAKGAEGAYVIALQLDRVNVDAIHGYCRLLIADGRHFRAARILRAGIEYLPHDAALHNHLGIALMANDRHGKALEAYDAAIALLPIQPEFHLNRAGALDRLDRSVEAEEELRLVIRLDPASKRAYALLTRKLMSQGRIDEALAVCESLVSSHPNDAEALHNAGVTAINAGRLPTAVPWLERAVACAPRNGLLRSNLCGALREIGRAEDAVVEGRLAARLQPKLPGAHYHLALALAEIGEFGEALAAIDSASRLEPTNPDYHVLAAGILGLSGRPAESSARLEEGLRHSPEHLELRYRIGQRRLQRGDFEQGWADHEWRLKTRITIRRPFTAPRWDGRPIPGGTLFVHAEQGLGDTLQFVRFLPQARAQSQARILFEPQGSLVNLLRDSAGADRVIAQPIDFALPSDPYDAHVALLSLPNLLGTRLDSLPNRTPYVAVPEDAIRRMSDRIGDTGGGLKVGLRWAGNSRFVHDRFRSCTLADLAPLAAVRDVRFFSLQTDARAADVADPPDGMEITNLSGELTDFMDTAAALRCLDLLITTDTSMPHLAGAIGVPVWIATPFAPHWAWMLDRDDTAWYPTARLFRQTRLNDWKSVFESIAAALADLRP